MSPDCGLTEGKEGNEVNFAKLWECVRVFAPLLGNASRLKAMRGRIALLERFAQKLERIVPSRTVVMRMRRNPKAWSTLGCLPMLLSPLPAIAGRTCSSLALPAAANRSSAARLVP